ncbi:MAG: extracellular solute-binding protein [Succinivibrio sp.]|uniref:Putrescine-binding periplasmic protein n=2 Tax=Succinivibrio TaxID=83770 RepID=A0ABS7DIG4_9GAMM|nr:extracellular solute-binding protein [Succinivibrio faecicola]MBQ2382335.1 extracellular solute-binding protein [Succinivibrio sp.]MBW7571068.1 extracellular solute-binding protein [Succinivibrio faecicola]
MIKKLMSLCVLGAVASTSNCAFSEESNQVNIWNWSYNIGEHTVSDFEKDTGLKTTYVEYDSNELQEARLLAGNTGFDAAIVVSYYVPRMAKSGALQKIDHSKIPNWVKQNRARLEKLATLDPNNDYAYPYIEISIGIGYNKQKIEEIFGKDYKIDSWDFLFKKENSDKLKKCGIAIIDSPIEVISAVQHYLKKDPISTNPKDFEEAKDILTKLASNTAYFQSNRYVTDLASGEICAAIGYSGDFIQSRHLAAHGKNKYDIEYVIPKEGSIMWFDSWTVPRGAKNYDNAMKWFNWLLTPENAKKLSDEMGYILPVDEAMANVSDELKNNESIMLSEEKLKTMYFMQPTPAKTSRITNNVWNAMKIDSAKIANQND